MFGTTIQELFGSISVGILTSILTFYLFHYSIKTINCDNCQKEKIIESHKSHIKYLNTQNTALALILFIFVYALGQLMEDVTDNLTDSSQPKIPLNKWGQKIIGAEKTFRYKVLIKEKKPKLDPKQNQFISLWKSVFSYNKMNPKQIELTSLGKYVFSHKDIVSQILKNNDIDQNVLLSLNQENPSINSNEEEKIKNAINAIYYKSKNWCYTNNQSNFRELELIQNRINFSRSTVLISFLFIMLISILTLYQILRILFSSLLMKIRKKTNLTKEIKNLEWLWKRNIVTISFLIGLFVLAKIGYSITEQNFNERVLGYYFSNIDQVLIEDILKGKLKN